MEKFETLVGMVGFCGTALSMVVAFVCFLEYDKKGMSIALVAMLVFSFLIPGRG